MPDRILRDELWGSDRFLDLPSDTHRLAFIRLVNVADDFGNLEGGGRRIYRMLHSGTQVKTPEHCAGILGGLVECDLLRRYEVEGREFFHIPRFGQHRNYRVRKVPPSPWCDAESALGKNVRVSKQGLAKNLSATLLERSSNVAVTLQGRSRNVLAGVGVGVGVGDGVGVGNVNTIAASVPPRPAKRAVPAKSEAAPLWEAYRAAFHARYKVEPVRNARVNALLAQVAKRLPADDGPGVISWFLRDPAYSRSNHALALLVRDCEGLHARWRAGVSTASVTRQEGIEQRNMEIAAEWAAERGDDEGF